MSVASCTLRAVDLTIELGSRPLLMGVLDPAPVEAPGDGGPRARLDAQVESAAELLREGADILDLGGGLATESLVALLERTAGELGAVVCVDVREPSEARAAVAAGARVVNDASGLLEPGVAEVCAQSGAALVLRPALASARGVPREPDRGRAPLALLRGHLATALASGMHPEQLILAPAETIALERLHELGRPLLIAVSRPQGMGEPAGGAGPGRLARMLAALADGVERGAHIFRVHDVAAAADFLTVRAALVGELEPSRDLALDAEIRYDRLVSD